MVDTWVDFQPDPGWSNNSIRARLINLGRSTTVQIIGDISGPLPSQARARVGNLPQGYYPPLRGYRDIGTVLFGVISSWAVWEILVDGSLFTVWGAGASGQTSTASINAILPMD